MNIVGMPPANCGLIICAEPTLLNALTKCAAGNAFCSCSISESLTLVKNDSTPLTGGPPPIGLQASITILPAKFSAPESCAASIAADPATASTTTSANFAASAFEPTRRPESCDAHS